MKKHHKVILGSFSSILIAFLIINTVFIYFLFTNLQLTKSELETQIQENQQNSQAQINELVDLLIETQKALSSVNQSFKTELSEIKATTSADFSGIINQALPKVLTVRTDISQGTGFIIDEEGYFVTNAHVLYGATQVFAINSQQNILAAEFIGYDETLDVALLKLNGTYEKFELANSNSLEIGEKVIAIGNPLGLQFSVSEGIISALDRPGPSGLEAYIQTDAALNPGNSGGPLINRQGKVVGINNFKVGNSENLGFALESNLLKEIINDISKSEINQTIL